MATYFSDLIEKDSNFAKLDKTEKEGYYISLTAKRFEILSKKFTDEITINNTVFAKESLKVKKLNSAVKITSAEFTKISNAIFQLPVNASS